MDIMPLKGKKSQSGQVALVALLVLTIATTVGLSLISRTTTEISIATNTEDSTRAFSAAEAGIEASLVSGAASNRTIDAALGLEYNVTVASISGTANEYIFPRSTVNGETETVWLVNHDNQNGSVIETPTYTSSYIDVCWSDAPTQPAVLVTVLYKESSDNSYQIAKGVFDPYQARQTNDAFTYPTAVSGGCGSAATKYRQRVTFADLVATINPAVDTLIALRIRPLFSPALLSVKPAMALPYQGRIVQSIGKTASGVTRKVVVYQQYRSAGTIFDSAVYSEGQFSH